MWKKFARLRTQLFPYIYTAAHVAHYVRCPRHPQTEKYPMYIIIITIIIIIIVIIFYVALFSALEQTHCAHVACDSE